MFECFEILITLKLIHYVRSKADHEFASHDAGVPLLTVGTAGVLDYIPQDSCVPGVEVLEAFDPDVIARTVRRMLFDSMMDCGGSSNSADLSSFWNEERVGREYVRLYEWLMRG